jgi:hypothetical protein
LPMATWQQLGTSKISALFNDQSQITLAYSCMNLLVCVMHTQQS